FLGSPVDRHAFAKGVGIANLETCRRALVAVVLRFASNDAMRKEAVVGAHSRVPGDDDVAVEPAPLPDLYVRTDRAEWADINVFAQFGPGVDMCQRRNFAGHISDSG